MLNSAGGGEAPDRRVEGVMSRPAGEALPQRPRPAPPRPHRWCCCPGCWTRGVGGRSRGNHGHGPRAPPLPPPPSRSGQIHGSPWAPKSSGKGGAPGGPGCTPRPAPGLPLPPCAPLPCTPLPSSLPGRRGAGRAGGGAEPGLRARPLRAGRPDPAAGPRAPRALRRLRLLLSPPPSATASRVSGPWLCPSQAGAARAPADPREARRAAPPWSSGPEAGGCCARPPRWPPAPAGTLPARAEAAAKSARSTAPRASA